MVTLDNDALPVNMTPGRNVRNTHSLHGIISRKFAFKSTSHDSYVSQAFKFDASVLKYCICRYYCQHNAVYVVGNTDVGGNVRQTLQRCPSNRFVYSRTQIAF